MFNKWGNLLDYSFQLCIQKHLGASQGSLKSVKCCNEKTHYHNQKYDLFLEKNN